MVLPRKLCFLYQRWVIQVLWRLWGGLEGAGKMGVRNDDDKIPRCVWGEKIIGKYSHRIYKIDSFDYRRDQVWLRECLTGALKIVSLDQLFDNFEHYIPWYKIGKNETD